MWKYDNNKNPNNNNNNNNNNNVVAVGEPFPGSKMQICQLNLKLSGHLYLPVSGATIIEAVVAAPGSSTTSNDSSAALYTTGWAKQSKPT